MPAGPVEATLRNPKTFMSRLYVSIMWCCWRVRCNILGLYIIVECFRLLSRGNEGRSKIVLVHFSQGLYKQFDRSSVRVVDAAEH